MADAELLSGQTDRERLRLKQTWPHLHSLHEGTINEKTLHLKKSFIIKQLGNDKSLDALAAIKEMKGTSMF